MIRFSKILFLNQAKIWISGVKCSYDNVIKIANIFDWKWIALTIDSVTEESPLLRFVKNQKLKYSVKQRSTNYIEISVVVSQDLFSCILKEAISEDPENIFVFNLLYVTNWDIHLQCSFEELVATGITNAFISISLDENALLISVNKSLIQPQKLYRKIKALQFD